MNNKPGVDSEHYPVLFDYYPDLIERMSWTLLGSLPTPVHRLRHFHHDNLWIKRDDKTSSTYGGNKVRKLEFLLADAIKMNKTGVVTIGGIGTNHGLATAIYCRQLDLSCTLLLFHQPVTQYVRQNLLLFHRYGAELVYKKGVLKTALYYYLTQLTKYRNAYAIYAGGSSPTGIVGFVNAAFELKKQIEENQLPMPDYIICPLGSAGTLTGLALGVKLAGLRSEVIGVRVTYARLGPFQLATSKTVKALMEKTYRYLRERSREVPEIEIHAPRILDDYFGEGYGYPTRAGMEALELFREHENIKLEPTYTAKTCAALLDFIRDPSHASDRILYWHTYSSVDLSGEAAAVDYRELPAALHPFFEGYGSEES
jgi:1-aminocyclopropane-1-carboxylate deaminase/D-cysteine desulfhydrase-like pyridoxal-dependent ACC family enzyme